jgi:hypothetical protein
VQENRSGYITSEASRSYASIRNASCGSNTSISYASTRSSGGGGVVVVVVIVKWCCFYKCKNHASVVLQVSVLPLNTPRKSCKEYYYCKQGVLQVYY